MKSSGLLTLSLLLAACGSVAVPAAAPTAAPTPTALPVLLQAPTEACGTVRAWTPPTPTLAGSITLGSKTHTVNAGTGTDHGATGFVVAVGQDMCLFGGLDGQAQPYLGATRIDAPFCGAVLAFTPAAASAAGSITILHFAAATFPIQPGTDLGTPPLGIKRCVTVATTPAGDGVVRGRGTPAIAEMDIDLGCGAVKSYVIGSEIAIGSKRWEMVHGTAYDTAGPNGPDRTTGGKPMCLIAALDDHSRITRYLTNEMPPEEGGLVTGFAPATATTSGTLAFYYKYVRTIAAGTDLEVKVGAYTCVKRGLDGAGDGVVTGSVVCGGVHF